MKMNTTVKPMNAFIQDEARWYEAWLDTPIGVDPKLQTEARAPEDLLNAPGVCLKTYALASHGQWPEACGILVSLDAKADKVVVRGHGSPVSGKFVWEGTVREYGSTWRVD